MLHRRRIGRITIAGLLLLAIGSVLSSLAAPVRGEPTFVINSVAEKKVDRLPAGPLDWRIETFPTVAQAKAAEDPTSLAAEVAGKAWLFTLGPKGVDTWGKPGRGGRPGTVSGQSPRVSATHQQRGWAARH